MPNTDPGPLEQQALADLPAARESALEDSGSQHRERSAATPSEVVDGNLPADREPVSGDSGSRRADRGAGADSAASPRRPERVGGGTATGEVGRAGDLRGGDGYVLGVADAAAVRRANRLAAEEVPFDDDAVELNGLVGGSAAGRVPGAGARGRSSAATDPKYRSWFEEISAKAGFAPADQDGDLDGDQPVDTPLAARRRLDARLLDGRPVDNDPVDSVDSGLVDVAATDVAAVDAAAVDAAAVDGAAVDGAAGAEDGDDDPGDREPERPVLELSPHDLVIERVRTVVRGVGQTLISCGVVILLFVAYELWVTDLFNKHTQNQLASKLSEAWGQGEDPLDQATVGTPNAPGEPGARVRNIPLGAGIALIRIPALGLDYVRVVVEGTGEASLAAGPGHYVDTALPGQQGNFAVAGHRVGQGSPFLDLDVLRTGDAIVIETQTSYVTYRVLGDKATGNPTVPDKTSGIPGREIVDPSDINVITPTPDKPGAEASGHYITLTTCHPRFSARQRMIIHGVQDGPAWPKSKGVPPALRG